jgi:hypothetical protein
MTGIYGRRSVAPFLVTYTTGLVASLLIADGLQAELVLAYNVSPNTAGTIAASIANNVTPLPLSRTGVVQGNAESFDGTNFTTNAAADLGQYFEWGWSASGASRDLAALDIAYRRANTNGPEALRIDLSVNGGAFQTVFSDNSIASQPQVGGEANPGIDLSAFDNVTSATFRLYAWAATGSSGRQLEIKPNVALAYADGIAVYAVPEPSTLAFSLFGLMFVRRSRRW